MVIDNHLIITEQEIVRGCIESNRQMQELLYRRYAKEMYGICKGYTRDIETAKDILQEGFIKVFRNIKYFKGESLKGWIRRIIVNTAIDFYRKSIRENNIIVELEDSHIALVENDILERLQYEDLLKLFQKLPNGARLVFNLYAIEGYTHKEIAEELGISESTSKSQLNYARKILQDEFWKLYEFKPFKIAK